jgi:hypothetical protein
MQLEEEIPNFSILFERYQNIYNDLEEYIIEQEKLDKLPRLNKIRSEFNYCDIKLRMAFAINRIDLNHKFMQRKVGDLRLCHLLLYKFADLWFAYESFFDLYELMNLQSIQSKIIWLNQKKYSNYQNIDEISKALTRANEQINIHFDTIEKRESLIQYLMYCENLSSRGQENRMQKIIARLSTNKKIPQLNESELLTVAYSIRNNFVHNGETTVTTPELSYSDKKNLLIVLYEFIAILNLAITIKLMEKFYT